MFTMSARDQALYWYAARCALSALVSHSARFGRGWYLLAGGDRFVASEVSL